MPKNLHALNIPFPPSPDNLGLAVSYALYLKCRVYFLFRQSFRVTAPRLMNILPVIIEQGREAEASS
jgi:hypothetical protein